jgi:hypothetical protein
MLNRELRSLGLLCVCVLAGATSSGGGECEDIPLSCRLASLGVGDVFVDLLV